jgi:hypothetical protein
MKLYRIYTENKNRRKLEKEVSRSFKGFTIYETTGYWEGKQEDGIVIELLVENTIENANDIKALCQDIKLFNEQESILLTEQEVKAEFI